MPQLVQKLIQRSNWGKPGQDEGPPDLDKLFAKLFSGLRKGASTSKRPAGKSHSAGKGFMLLLTLVIIVFAAIWAVSGFFIVQPAERAVVLRFGKYLETLAPGPHWIPQVIESRQVVNVDRIMTMSLSDTMLTQKENIVDVDFAIQYRVSNLKNYLFSVINPKNSLRQIVDSAVRQVIGTSTLDNILTVGRAKIASRVQQQVAVLTRKYHLGLEVTDVAMQPAKAPEQVKAAFDDVIKAREDNQRLQNEADGYSNSIVPMAEGKATRILQQADAYQQQVIYRAKGHVAAFDALVPIYTQHPDITRSRMYLDTMQQVLANSHVTLIDTGNKANSLFYVPVSGPLRTLSSHMRTKPADSDAVSGAGVTATDTAISTTSATSSAGEMTRYLRWKEAQGNA